MTMDACVEIARVLLVLTSAQLPESVTGQPAMIPKSLKLAQRLRLKQLVKQLLTRTELAFVTLVIVTEVVH